jgi:hypothetical protein
MRSQATKLYRTFVKGLITEASPLTYPEDTSLDEDNCLLFTKGNRTRRLGANYEPGHTLSSFQVPSMDATPIAEYSWTSVGNNALTNFLCLQVSGTIYFFDLYADPISGAMKGFSIDLTAYAAPGATGVSNSPCQMASGKGYLFIAGEKITPLVVEYDPVTDTIEVESIAILIRDFEGVDDDLAADEEPDTLSALHHYNLRNQGWVSTTTATNTISVSLYGKYKAVPGVPPTRDPITEYKTAIGKYPGNNKQWFLGKTEVVFGAYQVGDFNPVLLNKAHVGNGRAPRGHYIVNAFNIDRAAVSGISGIDSDVKTYGPSSVAFFSGRAWWFARSGVYFSQIMTDKGKAGQCFQDADPTAEDISELLASDGGYIPIPAADEIVRGIEIGNGIMAFARNGVWVISGTDKGFSATEYQVTKVSTVGTDAPMSVVAADTSIYLWTKIGIQQISQVSGQFGPVPGAYQSNNISQETIDTLFKSVSPQARQFVKGVYDPATNTVHWAYKSEDFGYDYGYNRFLNLDLKIGAFYPWSFTSGAYPFICGMFLTPELNLVSNSETVTASGATVTASAVTVTAQGTELSAKSNFLYFVSAVNQGSSFRFTFGSFYNDEFVDWETFDSVGVVYDSFVESGFEILDDAFRKKQIVYLSVFFRQTEENFVLVGEDYDVDKPSSCFLTVKWDWSTSGNTGKWSQERQVYRHRRVPFVNPLDLAFNTGTKVVHTKNKIRGTGRAVQFRLGTNERGKNFDLLGWQALYSGGTAT